MPASLWRWKIAVIADGRQRVHGGETQGPANATEDNILGAVHDYLAKAHPRGYQIVPRSFLATRIG
jgi:hypothetical protein